MNQIISNMSELLSSPLLGRSFSSRVSYSVSIHLIIPPLLYLQLNKVIPRAARFAKSISVHFYVCFCVRNDFMCQTKGAVSPLGDGGVSSVISVVVCHCHDGED